MLFKVNPGLEVKIIDRSRDWVQVTASAQIAGWIETKAPDPDLKKTGLYIHFPFCRRACFYCHFFKKKYRPRPRRVISGTWRRKWACGATPSLPLDTVYIGGGSPSLLTAVQLAASWTDRGE